MLTWFVFNISYMMENDLAEVLTQNRLIIYINAN